MDIQNFKLSKKSIIIIAVLVVLALFTIFVIYGYRKHLQEIEKRTMEIEKEEENESKPEQPTQNANGKQSEELSCIFDDYRNGLCNSKEAIRKSGLSVGSFYRKLNKHETIQ